jgi:hypothetical protein
MWWRILSILTLIPLPALVSAQTCRIEFAVTVTQGVGMIAPGTRLAGSAAFRLVGRSFRQEGGSTAHLAEGLMTLETGVSGEIWALATTSQGAVADMVGVYARNVVGLSFGGVDYAGPMMITLYGPPGSQPDSAPPTTQAGWDAMDLRRSFAVHAQGYDRLAGDVTTLDVICTPAPPPPASVDNPAQSAYPAAQ